MSSYRRKKETESPEEEVLENEQISDSDSDSSVDTAVQQPIPQVEAGAGVFRKLFVLQHSFNFGKDSSVNAGRMKYDFTSLSYWWSLVQDYFKRNNLFLYWRTTPHGSNSCVVTGTILDLDSSESHSASWIVPLSKKTSSDTETTDMLKDGAYLSYFQRRIVFAMCGLITNEDAEAELDAAEGPERRSRKQSKDKTSSNELDNW